MSQTIDTAHHDAWFHAEVDAGIKEADDPDTQWVDHEDVVERLNTRRMKYAEELKTNAT